MEAEKKKNELVSFLLRFGISAALLWYLSTKIDFTKTFILIRSADLKYLVAAFVVFILVHFIILLRWFIFMKALELSVPAFQGVRYFLIGLFGNLFLPSSIGGDLIRVIGLCQGNNEKAKVVASVLLDRLSGFAAIVIIAICAFIFGYTYINDNSILVSIALVATGSIIVTVVLFNAKVYSFVCRIFNRLPQVKSALMNLHYNIMLLKDRKWQGIKGVLMSCLSQSIYASVFFLIAKGLNQDIRFIYFLIFVPLICVASSVPSIGGLGAREAGSAYLFTKVGVSSEIAVSFTLMTFIFMALLGTMGAIFYVFTLSSRRIQHSSSDAGKLSS